MSRPIRVPDYLLEKVDALAEADRRTPAQVVQLLLEQALGLQESGAADAGTSSAISQSRAAHPPVSAPDEHFKPDFGKKLKR